MIETMKQLQTGHVHANVSTSGSSAKQIMTISHTLHTVRVRADCMERWEILMNIRKRTGMNRVVTGVEIYSNVG